MTGHDTTSIVLIPGFMADEGLWSDMTTALEPFGPIIHGDLREGDTIEAMARRIVLACPPRCVLVGFSMGGYVARMITRLVPDRVVALVLVATSSRADSPEQAKRKAAAAKAVTADSFKGLSRPAIAASLHPAHAGDEDLISRVRAMGLRLGYDVFVRQSMAGREEITGGLETIACPTLVIAAAQDRLRSLDESRELCDGIPGATLTVIEHSGHMIPLEQPARLADAICSWLQALSTSGSLSQPAPASRC